MPCKNVKNPDVIKPEAKQLCLNSINRIKHTHDFMTISVFGLVHKYDTRIMFAASSPTDIFFNIKYF